MGLCMSIFDVKINKTVEYFVAFVKRGHKLYNENFVSIM